MPGRSRCSCASTSDNGPPVPKLITNSIEGLLDQLDELKTQFSSPQYRAVEKILTELSGRKIHDLDELVRFHELLLFVRAYPQNARVLGLAESLLKSFSKRVKTLRDAEVDLSSLESPEVSGIAGTSVTDTFTFPIVSWLARRHPSRIALDWDWFEDENRLSETWPRFIPLLEEDAFVEANVPYGVWLEKAKRKATTDVAWLIARFQALDTSPRAKAELFDSQKLYITWTPTYRATRTGMRLQFPEAKKSAKKFYHRDPLIQRRDVSLHEFLNQPPPEFEQLSKKQGTEMLDLARESSTIRYRELYGFTHGDPAKVVRASLGRGVELIVTSLPQAVRLPLRAYHAAMIFKNGVAVGYFEGLSLFERMESGFNLYYTFRDGETAWLYARVLNVFRHLLGVTAFAIDPYQIGHENEEGIESGAFWFYRKLGFRPTDPEILKLVLSEEQKIASRVNYRTSARTLRKLAAAPMIFELDSNPNQTKPGDWDRFQVRNIGFKAAESMGAKFAGDNAKFRPASIKTLARSLDIQPKDWSRNEQSVMGDFAFALSMVPDLGRWSKAEKLALAEIIRAKAGSDETRYLKLMQKHSRLRAALIRLGS